MKNNLVKENGLYCNAGREFIWIYGAVNECRNGIPIFPTYKYIQLPVLETRLFPSDADMLDNLIPIRDKQIVSMVKKYLSLNISNKSHEAKSYIDAYDQILKSLS